ncbi:MAG: tetratricopeptide repeat protein [Acidobacteria bacterium]|nr:tetratricopeptide repeat protein [Acidobacteriota bacterium]MBE3131191.1 tetratricopeptide repeat protein [Acidobacteriota bacterium]
MKKIAWICSFLLVLALVLSAQDYKGKGRVAGIINDEAGKPLEGVTVKLFSPKAQGGFTVQTDKDGKWLGAWIRSGSWNIDFEKIGYAPKKVSVEISENKKNPDIAIALTKVEGLVVTDEVKDILGKGNELFEKNDYAGALAVYQEIIAKYPDAYPLLRNIGNCYFAQEKYDLAEETYLKLLEKDPKNVEAMIAVGNCYANRGDTAKALEWYGKVEFEKIEDPIVLYNLGTNYYNNSKFEDALKFYRKATEKKKDFPDALYQLGLTYLNLQKNVEAIAAFEDYLKIDADSQRAAQVKGFLDYLRKK